MCAPQPQADLRHLWSYFDVKLIEKLTLLSPQPLYNSHKSMSVSSLAYDTIVVNDVAVWMNQMLGSGVRVRFQWCYIYNKTSSQQPQRQT